LTDTSTKILDTAQELIQTRGFSAMSFQHIAALVDIKKPSVIHHFPNKAALGVAVIQRYRDTFAVQLQAIKADPGKTAWDALEFYFLPYLAFAETPSKVCLCGALAGEILVLPEEMQVEVKDFMQSHQDWLEDIFRSGRKRGEFKFKDTPARLARTFFSALQGALLVKRSIGDISQVKDVQRVIRDLVRP
jgi:TetR/AcrR family transcriptional repressor of nem operon